MPLTGISTSISGDCGDFILRSFCFNFCIARTHNYFLQLVFWFAFSTARRMVGIITLTVLGAGLTILKLGIDLRRNIEKAKSTGLPYIVGREFDLSSFSYNFLVLIMMARW
jgi:hypothetical protein